jgi:hypothetical protein
MASVSPAMSSLTQLYERWVGEILDERVAGEPHATCGDCAMLDRGDGGSRGRFFHPSTKCCTYHPDLHNFLVGQILRTDPADGAAARGRAAVEERLARGVGVTPLGMAMPPAYRLLYHHSPGLFGHALAMRCPYYIEAEGGRCGVWRHRAAVCATWHCKHERGDVGRRFWQALHQLLAVLERQLARHCVLELDPGEAALVELFPAPVNGLKSDPVRSEDLDGVADPARQRALWGRFHGGERELFVRCAELVDALSTSAIVALGGAEAQLWIRRTRDAQRALRSEALPERLAPAPVQLLQIRSGRAVVSGYSAIDPVRIPERLLELLRRFDGRTTDEVLADLETEGIHLERTLVRRLVDFKLLG